MLDLIASPSGDALSHIRIFLAALGAEVIRAAGTFGGSDAEARALRLLEQVRDGTPSAGQVQHELDWLWGLLSLACLDPTSAEAEALCALTDALAALFDRIGAPKCPFA